VILSSVAILSLKYGIPEWAGLSVLVHFFWNSVTENSADEKFRKSRYTLDYQLVSFLNVVCPKLFLIPIWLCAMMVFNLTLFAATPVAALVATEFILLIFRVHYFYKFRYAATFSVLSANARIKHALEMFGTFLLCAWSNRAVSSVIMWSAFFLLYIVSWRKIRK